VLDRCLCDNVRMSVATVDSEVSAELGQIKQELLDARERARRLSEGLTDTLWATAPGPGRWSIAECLIHLNITSERFIPIVDDAIREGREMGVRATAPLRRDLMGWLLAKWLEPPYRTRSRTTAPFVPARIEPMADVLERFDYLQGELLVRIDRAQGLPLERLRVVSPFNAKVKYNLYSAFRLIPVHQRRHLWQAEQVRALLDQQQSASVAP
jgi:DinB superfamily